MKVSDQSSIVGWVIWFCTLGVRIFVVGHPAIINCHANTTWWIAGAFAQHKNLVTALIMRAQRHELHQAATLCRLTLSRSRWGKMIRDSR